ncbi:MAG: hypothetical protein LBD68_09655 [Zoogloeaceae bacterium]|nr:hypothetical protein [Zoogloeaceae bacterium]
MRLLAENAVARSDADGPERDRVITALERTSWVQAKAARLLNMTPAKSLAASRR